MLHTYYIPSKLLGTHAIMVHNVLARQETGNYNKERVPSFGNPQSGGGACNGEQTLHTLHL